MSKYLHFARPSSLTPLTLVERKTIDNYISKLEDSGVGPDGIVTKLQRIQTALEYLLISEQLDTSSEELFRRAEVTKLSLRNWRSTLSKEKRRKQIIRLEELSDVALDFEQVNRLIESRELLQLFNDTVKEVSPPARDTLDCMVWIAARSMYKNSQRPGAIVNMTLKEVTDAIRNEHHEGDDHYLVIRVSEHKTATSGTAKVVFKNDDIELFRRYLKYIRPKILGKNTSHLVFPMPSGRAMANFNQMVQNMAGRYGLDPPSATKVRKIVSTASASLEQTVASKVATHMSHSVTTQKRYYAATRGGEDAREGFEAIQTMRTTPKNPTPPPQPKKRRAFTNEETKVITLYFQQNVAQGIAPSMAKCNRFLEEHEEVDRSAKDIYDKVRNIIKSNI